MATVSTNLETTTNMVNVVEPSILTAKTYFYTPSSNANGRRSAERKNVAIVKNYFQQLGMTIKGESDTWVEAEYTSEKLTIVAFFKYEESCNNVYRHLDVTKNGNRSNITALRNLQKQMKAV